MVRRILLTVSLAAFCSCNVLDLKGLVMPTGEGVEKRFEQSREMNADLKHGVVETEEAYTFYVATDPHINETHRNLSMFNDAFRNDASAPFGVILGDCIDVRDNLPAYLSALAYNPEIHQYNSAVFHVLGNHDIFFNGWVDFKDMVGPSSYWFEVVFEGGKDLFITLDTATGTLGRKQIEWFKSFLSDERTDYRHCVILTHTNFFYTDNSQATSGNMPFEESMALLDFLGRQDVTLVLQGHDHYREDLEYDGTRYVVVGAIHDETEHPEYLKVNVASEGISLEFNTLR